MLLNEIKISVKIKYKNMFNTVVGHVAVVSWLAHRYANPKVRGSNPGLDRLRIFMV